MTKPTERETLKVLLHLSKLFSKTTEVGYLINLYKKYVRYLESDKNERD